jgi:hypothetical protein
LTTTTKASGAVPPDRITVATNNFPYNVLNAQRNSLSLFASCPQHLSATLLALTSQFSQYGTMTPIRIRPPMMCKWGQLYE